MRDIVTMLVPEDLPGAFSGMLNAWYNPVKPGCPEVTALVDDDLGSLIENLHYANFQIWRFEEQARYYDTRTIEAKMQIDTQNQKRNDLIEQIDRVIIDELKIVGCGLSAFETPGTLIDRLSVVLLKNHHLQEKYDFSKDEHFREECQIKLLILADQVEDLIYWLNTLIWDCRDGRRHFRVFRQLKQYNDPRFRPSR